jgi:hypothetical protein
MRRAELRLATRSFTVFLQEGYYYAPSARTLPPLALQAIAGAIFEIVQRHVAGGQWDRLRGHVPLLAYLAIAPFAGPDKAIALVQELTAREDEAARRSGAQAG